MKRFCPAYITRGILIGILIFTVFYGGGYAVFAAIRAVSPTVGDAATAVALLPKKDPPAPEKPAFDTKAYNAKLLFLAHVNTASTTSDTSTVSTSSPQATTKGLTLIIPGTDTMSVSAPKSGWPAKTVYPNAGALLPNNRIVAYYGNFYSKGMGVLGEYPEAQMLAMLKDAMKQWQDADPATPVIPAIDYIVITAQGSAGKDGKYRLRMPTSQIDHAIDLANKVNGIVILDVQVGLSNLQTELPQYEDYLKMPNVHLAIDPEFAMHDGTPPGRVIGTMSSADVNYAAQYLAKLVKENNLPPKILVVHRFTEDMVTGYQNIKPLPEVQMVMDMDGWGFGAKKINTYKTVVQSEPVQFTGFKLFYKNDVKPPSTRMLTPREVLDLTPSPSFIQYQ